MSTLKSKYSLNERDIQPARVKRDEGWREMNIKWLLGEKTVGIKSAVLFKAVIKAGAAHEKHLHHKADELVYIISGKGRHGLGDEEWDIGPGDAYLNPREIVHWSYGTDQNDPLILVGVYVGAGSLEDTGYEFVEALNDPG
ncbi:MAG: cupin domain-containing protein [Betaproteobacteria bacterium]|nr:cupin domain-containing protein [Betaproteobacteria bacterium]